MTDAQLTYWSSWASIISFFVSVASLLFVRSIRANIIRFRRKQRIKQLLDEVQRIHDDAIPLGKASKTKLAALQRNIPAGLFACFTERGRAARALHNHIKAEDLAAVKEALNDWQSYSEDP
ncbi:MAG: hypothetical protein KDJ54_19470 [Candidatus Competibacteraceae bacterium]|nr:hypothetical protein [Candidatus Competibacteraceae bacterium]